jgi:ribosomal protein S27E
MNTLSLRVRYRPVRLGFCVEKGNHEDLRQALRLTHTFWGGRFNPIIPVEKTDQSYLLAKSLVEVFQVDALYAVRETELVKDLIGKFPHLIWPTFDNALFTHGPDGWVAEFLDVYHPVRNIFEEHVRDRNEPRISPTVYEWSAQDPLNDVFLATFGSYPTLDDIRKDYVDLVVKNLRGERVVLNNGDPIPNDATRKLTPSVLSAWKMNRERRSTRDQPGFYVGQCGDFDDIVNFWNLRAADIELIFYDPIHSMRLDSLKASHLAAIEKLPPDPSGWGNRPAVWSKNVDGLNTANFGWNCIASRVRTDTWNAANGIPSLVYFDEHSVLASMDESRSGPPSISFQLPKKPFFTESVLSQQRVVVSFRPIVDVAMLWESTLRPPHIPELNEYYGREADLLWNQARSERDGLGVVTTVGKDHLTIRALSNRELISKIFEAFGMKAEPSRPGLVASRLIGQMGGVQGCRVFKIRGVRKLIEKYGPLESFTRSGAVQTIGQNDPETGRPNFELYQRLFIEERSEPNLRPQDAFEYLVKRGVFQVGLKVKCSNCELDSWVALDKVATEIQCELCGRTFNIASQLRDRDWAYRRSGLFGREDHQEGSIPVALTLQQFDTVFAGDMIYSTAMNISSLSAPVSSCETDFVLIGRRNYEDRVTIAIGECKSNKEITEEDVQHLAQIADAFPPNRITTYIVFSKTSTFSPDEVARCRASQNRSQPHVILLSERELEPYWIYERTKETFEIRHAASLADLARATHDVFFEPKLKKVTNRP